MAEMDCEWFEGLSLDDVETKVETPLQKLPAEEEDPIDELTCAICLEQTALEDIASTPCAHSYCAKCILLWAVAREGEGKGNTVQCPQCKQPFTSLSTYRSLDGTLTDFPVEESVVLLKRARWFEAHLKAAEKGKAALISRALPEDSCDYDYARYYEEYDDDEEIEDFYFSSAAGRARIVVGNRRWGAKGYVAAGRMHARPVAPTPPSKGKGKGKVHDGGASGSNTPTPPPSNTRNSGKAKTPPTAAIAVPERPSEGGSGSGGNSYANGSSPGSSFGTPTPGRRARRSMKRTVDDGAGSWGA